MYCGRCTSSTNWRWAAGKNRAKNGELKIIEEIVVKYKPIIGRLKFLIQAMQPQGVQRLRKQEDGDEIDLNAAVRAMIDKKLPLLYMGLTR